MLKKIDKLFTLIRNFFKNEYYSFTSSHKYLNRKQMLKIESLLNYPNENIIVEYENAFSSLIGGGCSVSYASARMGFFSLMSFLKIGKGDEVVLLAATCSVMSNAVLRVGAIPIYSDIDPNTFGSDIDAIKKVVSKQTKMIVAQHSFGIPCDIKPIVEFAKKNSIFLLEDCALSLGSKFNGVRVGNFGDAAIFSTDKSKPLNTLTGGVLYSTNCELIDKLKVKSVKLMHMPSSKHKLLFSHLKLERKFYSRSNESRVDTLLLLKSKIFSKTSAFLDEDFSSKPSRSYPYPSRMPSFLAQLGLYELRNWEKVATNRCLILSDFIKLSKNSKTMKFFPKAYNDSNLLIIPHRIVWSQPDGETVRERLSCLIDVSWTWFLKPIVATKEPLYKFGYKEGSCPKSELITKGMVNLPTPSNQNIKKYVKNIVNIVYLINKDGKQ